MYNKNFMQLAYSKAKEDKKEKKDIPVCALVEHNSEILSIKVNEKEKTNRVIAHAEILALDEANLKLGNWRLSDCDMYVTLEPCPMCAFAILSSRIKNLYFGSYDSLYGAFSVVRLDKFFNSKTKIKGGMMEKECNLLLEDYFKELRNEK